MKCPKCGKENSDNAKFCTDCGSAIESKPKSGNNNRLIIIALVAIVIVLAGVAVYASGILTPQVEFESKKFDGFTMDVPVDSDYVLSDEHTTDPENIFVGYRNNDYDSFLETSGFFVGNNVTKKIITWDSEFLQQDGDLYIYKNDSDGMTLYKIFKEGNDANLVIMGFNLDAIKHMANSFKDKGFLKLGTPTTTTAVSSSTSSTKTTTESTESGSWQSVGSYSGSGSGSERINIPQGKIMVKFSAYPIKNYATNHLYVTSSTGDSGGVDWGSTSAVETRSDSFTFTSKGSQTLDIDYYETVSWEVEIFKYQ